MFIAFTEDELLKLWKGLFYCMWMSDKPLIQEDLAETIASLIHSVEDRATGLMFFSISIRTLARDWAGIDTWRVDKFLMVSFINLVSLKLLLQFVLLFVVHEKNHSPQPRVPG